VERPPVEELLEVKAARPPAPPPAAGARAGRPRLDWVLFAGPAATLAMTLWGIGAWAFWGDEADTLSAVSRPWPQVLRLLGHVDAVHGLYYLLLWPVARLAGTGALAVRLPSALAMAAAAAGVAVIARRLASRRAALYAGLVFAVLPAVSLQGHDARPYALVTAAATAASYLLLRVAADPRPGWLAGYAAALTLAGYLQLFALLLIPAHAVTLAALRHRAGRAGQPSCPPGIARRWLAAVAAAAVAVTPVAALGWTQRVQVAWIPPVGWPSLVSLLTTLAAVPAAAVLLGLLGLLGAADVPPAGRPAAGPPAGGPAAGLPGAGVPAAGGPAAGGPVPGGAGAPVAAGPPGAAGPAGPLARWAQPGYRVAWLAGPWLVLPPGLLLGLSELKPMYDSRYVTFCLPAVALLAGAGLAALRWPVAPAALAVLLVMGLPLQLQLRVPHGVIGQAARYLGAHERPGDAIVYPGAYVPPWSLAFPRQFGRLRDLSLGQTASAAGQLYGRTVPRSVLLRRERGVHRIWVVQMGRAPSPAGYLAPTFRLAVRWGNSYLRIRLYRTATHRAGPGQHGKPRPGGH
jgi:mannosyltransferase